MTKTAPHKVLVASLLLAAALTTGCGKDDPAPPAPTTPARAEAPTPHEQVESPAEAAMIDALNTAYTVHPMADQPGDSWDRARPLLDPKGNFPGQGDTAPRTTGLGEWYSWQSRGIEVVEATTTILPDYHPEDTKDTAMRVVLVSRTAKDFDGNSTEEPPRALYATAKLIDGRWLLSAAEYRG